MNATLYFDGSCSNPPDQKKSLISAGWFIIFDPNNFFSSGFTKQLKGGYTSQHAEWMGLHSGLTWLASIHKIKKVIIRGDNEGVINNLRNKECNKKDSISYQYFKKCTDILDEMKVVCHPQWIKRDKNWAADQLSRRQPLDLKFVFELEQKRNFSKITSLVAKTLWENAGRPYGRDTDFWFEAERMVEESLK